MKLTIVFEPAQNHLNEIEVWLKEEREKTNDGFYCNWKVIKQAFTKGQMYCAVVNKEALGFLVWWKSGSDGGIDILEVHPKLRGKGVGRRLVEATLTKLGKEGVSAIYLECQPPTSEPFWRHLGFVDAHAQESNFPSSSIKLYRKIS